MSERSTTLGDIQIHNARFQLAQDREHLRSLYGNLMQTADVIQRAQRAYAASRDMLAALEADGRTRSPPGGVEHADSDPGSRQGSDGRTSAP